MDRLSERPEVKPLAQHNGFFRLQLSTWQAVALLVSGTIGAGVLGIPYAVAKIGLVPGLIYIGVIGLLMMGMNLLAGEIAVRTKRQLQLSGLAARYLGPTGKWIMTVIVYLMLVGTMLVYIIGEGETLSTLFGGDPLYWSLVFFAFGTLMIFWGMRWVKVAELLLTLALLLVVILIGVLSAPHVDIANFGHASLIDIFLPYGVLLFAFHGVTVVPEVHSLLKDNHVGFRKTILIAGVISMIVYMLFTTAVLGVTGVETTQIATIGLGAKGGAMLLLIGNVFAALAMGTSFIIVGLGMRDSLIWDFKFKPWIAASVVSILPLLLFLSGFREFIMAIDIVGGVFMSLEMLLVLLIYWKAKQMGDLPPGKYRVHHATVLAMLLLVALTLGVVYSVIGIVN